MNIPLTVGTCTCDFCTGKKSWEDNWCARCVQVLMQAPKWHENLDVCDACEEERRRETPVLEVE